ncbi:MAG: hypothetical protein KF726_26425 [Anaerolineae bacterium]|nr:hypothetical protein [Anaerolineae bacterium]
MRKYIVLLILAALCLIPQPTAAQGGEESWLLNQVNALRAQNGRGALSWNSQLAAAALAHSQVLATTPWVGPHIEANGSTPQSRAAAQGYGGSVGENVVGGGTATLEWAWNWWMNSAVHVSNMLGNWNEVGIAVANGSTGRFYTMVFGNNGGAAPPPPPPPASDDTGASNAGSSGGAQQVVSARPTRPPPPTSTPTITFTPSITFTPRATYTGMPTITPIGPTETPIVMELAPDESTEVDTAVPPATSTPEQAAEPPTPTAQAVAMLATDAPQQPAVASVETPSGTSSSNGLRNLLPLIIGAQFVIVVGLVVRATLRRRRR